jgi:hypothetical protein
LREALAALVAAPFLVGAALAPAGVDGEVLFRFTDPEIVESSGLVATADIVVTVNDSGDSARVFAVDPSSGDTVGVTTWPGDPVDVEALAPAPDGEVWVGDIGDNRESRSSVTVTRVAVGRSDADVAGSAYELVWPGGARDAEALLAHPRTGRLFVVSKRVLGGEVFAAPSALSADRPNRLERIGDAPGLVTDGAFFPDGRHLVLRGYGIATVLAFPSLDPVGEFELPEQEQGEGIAVAPDGAVLLSSEGVRSEVLRVDVPPEVRQAMAPPAADPTPVPSASPGSGLPAGQVEDSSQPRLQRDPWPWVVGFLLFLAALVVLVRSLRPPHPDA